MNITPVDLITWLIIGGLVGPLIGKVIKGKKQGFGLLTNLGVGLVGALIGGVLFTFVPIARPLAAVSVNLEDIVSALAGAVIFLLAVRFLRRKVAASKAP